LFFGADVVEPQTGFGRNFTRHHRNPSQCHNPKPISARPRSTYTDVHPGPLSLQQSCFLDMLRGQGQDHPISEQLNIVNMLTGESLRFMTFAARGQLSSCITLQSSSALHPNPQRETPSGYHVPRWIAILQCSLLMTTASHVHLMRELIVVAQEDGGMNALTSVDESGGTGLPEVGGSCLSVPEFSDRRT
jgi:hypothetical protein